MHLRKTKNREEKEKLAAYLSRHDWCKRSSLFKVRVLKV